MTSPKTSAAEGTGRRVGRFGLAVLLQALVGFVPAARADFVVVNSQMDLQFSTRQVVSTSLPTDAPTFAIGADGIRRELQSPGGGFGMIGGPVGDVQSFSMTNGTFLTAMADPGRIGSPSVPFGSGQGSIRAISSSDTGLGINVAGISWDPSAVGSGATPGAISMLVANSTITFRNTGLLTSGVAGAALSIFGSLASATGADFAAAALVGAITINGVTTQFAPIVFAYDGDGEGTLTDVSLAGSIPSLNADGANFDAFGVSRLSLATFINPGQEFTLTGTLTLIADPASITLFEIPLGGDLPDLGIFALRGRSIPEPSAAALAALGAAGLGLAAPRRRRGRGAQK